MIITFLPNNIKQPCQKGESLLNIAGKANVLIDGSCGGKGKCGKCKVKVISGKATDLDAHEISALTEKEIKEGYRLACRLTVEDDLVIFVPQNDNTISRKTKLTVIPEDFNITNYIKKKYLMVEAASLENQKGDIERILQAFPKEWDTIDPSLLIDIPRIIKESQSQITVVAKGKRIIALEIGDTEGRSFGVAFDIGTTTVVGMLWDLNKGELVGVSAQTNPQSIYGADVISRINYSSEDKNNLIILKTKIRDCLNEIIQDFIENFNIESNEIYEATIVGNTTMSHLFLGINPSQLAKSPFNPVFCLPVDVASKDIELNINPQANIHLLPNIAGHVGSDIAGVLLASRIIEKDGLNLAIDVGTNGEIVIAQNGRVLTCSTAAGPAFEGASIYQGMRAASGAIEGVKIENGEITLEIIDNIQPIGICGSGLIDAVAQMLNEGIVDHTGRLMDTEKASINNVDTALLPRLRKGKKGNEFVLVFRDDTDDDIVITQKDIREVQLAKGAIYGGIVSLLNELGAKPEDIDTIFLAGAFGNYIKKENALRIGLFPKIESDRIIPVGNAAGAGACMALLSLDERKKAYIEVQKVEHVELAGRDDFQIEFLNAMNFS